MHRVVISRDQSEVPCEIPGVLLRAAADHTAVDEDIGNALEPVGTPTPHGAATVLHPLESISNLFTATSLREVT